MKKTSIIIALFCSFFALAQKVQFKDKNFEKIVLDRYDLDKNGIIDENEHSKIVILNTKGVTLSTYEDVYKFNVRKLYLDNSDIRNLTLKEIPTLRILSCINCNLNTFEVENMPNLVSVNISNNNLKKITLKNSPNIYRLDARNNALSKIDFIELNKLEDLHISENNFDSIDINNLSQLTFLDISNNNFTMLDISNNLKLSTLLAFGNKLKDSKIKRNKDHKVEITFIDTSKKRIDRADLPSPPPPTKN